MAPSSQIPQAFPSRIGRGELRLRASHYLFPCGVPTHIAPLPIRLQRHEERRGFDERLVGRALWGAAALDAIHPVHHVIGLLGRLAALVAFREIGALVVGLGLQDSGHEGRGRRSSVGEAPLCHEQGQHAGYSRQ